MPYNLANLQANASPPPYVVRMESHGHGRDGHSFLGYSSETDKETILSWYRDDTTVLISKLRRLFVFCADSAVTDFFILNPDLANWLVRSQAVLTKHFDADTKFLLKPALHTAGNDHPRMVVYIQTRLPVADAMERLDAFDEEWLFDQIDFIGNKIIFNLAPL